MVKLYTVPTDIADNVEKWVTGTKIPWFYFNHTLGYDAKGKIEVDECSYTIRDLPRFTHYFYPKSKTEVEDKAVINPLIDWLTTNILPGYKVRRVMGNMTTRMPNGEMFLNLPHVDSDVDKMVTFLYYVNTSDGKTVFFKDGKIDCEVEPVKGMGALFPSSTTHAGQVPSINNTRYVINIILEKRD